MDREDEKKQHPLGFEPTTSLLRGVRSTSEIQPLPELMGGKVVSLGYLDRNMHKKLSLG